MDLSAFLSSFSAFFYKQYFKSQNTNCPFNTHLKTYQVKRMTFSDFYGIVRKRFRWMNELTAVLQMQLSSTSAQSGPWCSSDPSLMYSTLELRCKWTRLDEWKVRKIVFFQQVGVLASVNSSLARHFVGAGVSNEQDLCSRPDMNGDFSRLKCWLCESVT